MNEAWGERLEGKQVQRWVQPVGERLVDEGWEAVRESESGRPPAGPENAPALLVIGLDGGRVQMREKDPETESRWKEDKVATVTSYLPGTAEEVPQALVTTHVATMEGAEQFGGLARVEAERRGLARAGAVVVLGDGGNWIDPLAAREFSQATRIVDFYHAAEHLHACSRALWGVGTAKATRWAEKLTHQLRAGRVDLVIQTLRRQAAQLGPPRPADGTDHVRRVVSNEVGYFEVNSPHMQYARYRRRGWPIGSGNVEAGVKQFNKRVKGTEQFWSRQGVEAILALRALLLCQDDRWKRYWRARPAYLAA